MGVVQQVDPASPRCEWNCVYCGYVPHVPPRHRAFLDDLDSDATASTRDYHDFFQTLGIICNTHIRILLGMDREDRDRILETYVPCRLSRFESMELSKMLQDYTDAHKWVSLSLAQIPRKGEAFETFLANPHTRDKMAAQYMRLSEQEFHMLMARVKHRVPWFLDIHRPFKDQVPSQIQALINDIRGNCPIFDRYKEAWPIFVFVKRILASGAGTFKSSPEPSPSFGQSRPHYGEKNLEPVLVQQHRCPRLAMYIKSGGHQHVSPTARSLLTVLDMDDELCPALFFLGVRDDAKFEMVRQMDPERKAQLIGQVNGLELSAIQRLVLLMIFEN
ncbi:hypothetical protein B0H15DRAFT_851457 [Mycena belliarum]|uniref:Uncharacterized protein n=1 Tax=Mycena belliarum TaxID=1033014 RepID=A0AAD6U393_9AGAR|nr:hypothetical protein B0H15DRAFT_851457 [Mycena belliae]